MHLGLFSSIQLQYSWVCYKLVFISRLNRQHLHFTRIAKKFKCSDNKFTKHFPLATKEYSNQLSSHIVAKRKAKYIICSIGLLFRIFLQLCTFPWISLFKFKHSKKVKEISTRRKNKLLVKKLWRSCDKIRVRFGDNNFLQELAPLR